jgi:hypothetical protein
MTADLPAPPVPADCDLRGMPAFMLDAQRLLGSELFLLSSGDAFKAAVSLWCRAWHQVPAASLPDDDASLAAYAGMRGPAWQKAKPMALRGFVRCSDGRLYHPVLAEDAMRAWGKRGAFRDRATKAAQARWEKRGRDATSMPQAPPVRLTSDATSMPQAMLGDAQGQGQGQGQTTKTTSSRRESSSSPGPIDDHDLGTPTPAVASAMTQRTTAGQSIADLQVLVPALLIRGEDRPVLNGLIDLWSWPAVLESCQSLSTKAASQPHGKRRVFADQIAPEMTALGYLLERHDYDRCGLPVPPDFKDPIHAQVAQAAG